VSGQSCVRVCACVRARPAPSLQTAIGLRGGDCGRPLTDRPTDRPPETPRRTHTHRLAIFVAAGWGGGLWPDNEMKTEMKKALGGVLGEVSQHRIHGLLHPLSVCVCVGWGWKGVGREDRVCE